MKQFFGTFRSSQNVRIVISIELFLACLSRCRLGPDLFNEGPHIAAKKPGEHHREAFDQALEPGEGPFILESQNLFRGGEIDIDCKLRMVFDLEQIRGPLAENLTGEPEA